jgi:signal transduction histidine kinase
MIQIPLPDNEEDRLSALESYHIFDTAEEKDLDALTALASAICQVPIALITFIDEKRQAFKSHHGTDLTENLRELSFCTHAIASKEPIMIVPDATLDERFADNPVVTGPTNINFYAGVPLINEDGFALGTICLIDQKPRELTAEQSQSLQTLAGQVMDKLELRRKVMVLQKANQELMNANVLIQKFASMAAHDIKNPLTSIMLTSQALKIRQQTLKDESSLRLVNLNITSTKILLELVDEMLNYSSDPTLLLAKKQRFSLNTMLKKIIGLLTVPDNVEFFLPEGRNELNLSVIAFEQIMLNLFSNAIRYNNKPKTVIHVRFTEDENFYRLEVQDNGIGIAPQYLEKIFGNNFTLKITDRYNSKGSGIGLSTVRDLLNVLGGSIYCESVVDEVTTFYIAIKKHF